MPIRPSVLIGKQIAEMLDPAKAGDGYFYLKGDANTDGSWRVMVVSGRIMSFQFRESGVWATKLAINPDDSQNYIRKTESVNSYINMDELRDALAINDDGAMDGRTPVLRATGTQLQWQYEGESAWRTLIDIASYIPEPVNGLTPQLRVNSGKLQSSFDGESWSGIFDLSQLKPEDGRSPYLRIDGGILQWQLEGDQAWLPLLDTLQLRGADGKSVSLRNSGGVIQQTQDGITWSDLFAVPRDGDPGPKNTLNIGTVTTVPNGSNAEASITGDSPNQLLNLSIPAGKDAVNLSIGIGVVTTLPAGSQATASLSGTYPNLLLNVGIPAGDAGKSASPTQFGIGTVSLAPYGSQPSVSITGNAPNQTLSFVIPAGKDGDNAIQPTFKVGTVTSGSAPAVTLSASGATNTLNFVLQKGDAGVGVSGSAVTYQASASGTTTPTGSWLSSVPSVTKGQYLWTRTVTTYTDGTSSTAYSVAYQAIDGQSIKGDPGPANNIKIGTVTTGTAAASMSGTSPDQTLNLTLPAGANGISYTPQTPVARNISPATAYQHTDTTKPYKVVVNARATQTVTVAGLVSDKVELRIGPTAAAVAAGGTGGFSVGIWESGITGIALMVGAAVLDGGQVSGDVPAGWYFSVNRLTGTNASIVSCFTQSLTP